MPTPLARRLLAAAVLAVVVLPGRAGSAASGPPCQVLTDAAGDASVVSGAPDVPALDVLSADIASGPRNVTVVVRVAELGTAVQAAPRLDMWMTYFTFRGNGFAASAARSLDGSRFELVGDFPEQTSIPGFNGAVQVTGEFDVDRNEVRVVFPRDLIGHTRAGEAIRDITVDSLTGVGSLATTPTSTYAGTTVDRTAQPGPSTSIGAPSCVQST
jgi:hypothetical protein